MAHALRSKAVAVEPINWSRALDIAILLMANFGIWTLIVSAPAVLSQLA